MKMQKNVIVLDQEKISLYSLLYLKWLLFLHLTLWQSKSSARSTLLREKVFIPFKNLWTDKEAMKGRCGHFFVLSLSVSS